MAHVRTILPVTAAVLASATATESLVLGADLDPAVLWRIETSG